MVTRLFPSFGEHPFVGIVVKQVHILNFIHQGLVILLASVLVAQIDVEHKTFVCEVGTENPFDDRCLVPDRHFISCVPYKRAGSITLQEHLLARGRIDTQRLHSPYPAH